MKHLNGYPLTHERRVLIEKGILAYLKDMDIDPGQMEEEQLFHHEFSRFSLMPKETFCTYFETYEVRESLLRLRRRCGDYAYLKASEDISISEQSYEQVVDEFFMLSKEISLDSRYTSWMEDIIDGVVQDLRYSLGKK